MRHGNTKRMWVRRGVGIAVLVVVAVIVVGVVVMLLWNALMPALFGLPTIGYWQAVGLLILSKLLFGGFGGRLDEEKLAGNRRLQRVHHADAERFLG